MEVFLINNITVQFSNISTFQIHELSNLTLVPAGFDEYIVPLLKGNNA